MSKYLALLLLLALTGCNVLAPLVPTPTAESRALAAVALAYHTPRAVTPLPTPSPSPTPGVCKTCSGRGWLGDGQPRSDCPDCNTKWDTHVFSQLPPTAIVPPPLPVIVPARIPVEEPPLFAPDIETCWESPYDILVCFTSSDKELATLTKTLTKLLASPNPPQLTFFHLPTTGKWGDQPNYEFWGVPKSHPSLHLFDTNRKLRASLTPARQLISSPEKLGAALAPYLPPPPQDQTR